MKPYKFILQLYFLSVCMDQIFYIILRSLSCKAQVQRSFEVRGMNYSHKTGGWAGITGDWNLPVSEDEQGCSVLLVSIKDNQQFLAG